MPRGHGPAETERITGPAERRRSTPARIVHVTIVCIPAARARLEPWRSERNTQLLVQLVEERFLTLARREINLQLATP